MFIMQEYTEEGFLWQISHADGGDFLVMRATVDTSYNQWIYDLSVSANKTLNSVSTIIWNDRTASYDPEVLKLVRGAEAIFFGGGDQSLYMDYWVGNQVQSIIQSKLTNITVGGTSAGLAIQGGCCELLYFRTV